MSKTNVDAKIPISVFFGIVLFTVIPFRDAHAYELATHAEISQSAFERSVLNNADFLKTLGISKEERFDRGFAKKSPPSSNEGDLLGWIREGAVSEDSSTRSQNHFFDPTTGRGLHSRFVQVGKPSPDWALEDKEDYGDQDHSYRHARVSFYEALTAKDLQTRQTKFASLFLALGRVIHHIEDMTQPQHVRNDWHLKLTGKDYLPAEHFSRYEKYTDEKRRAEQLIFDGYSPVNSKDDTNFLLTPRSFWHTQDKNPATGRGIAEFTNINFVSTGTNFDRNAGQEGYFQSPSLTGAVFDDQGWDQVKELFAKDNLSLPPECADVTPCRMTFVGTQVSDKYRPSASALNPKTATYSIFDEDLKANNLSPIYSLNNFNFDEAHKFLIPRAVAYSAGLIDYFFRGRLESEDAGYTDTGLSLRVRNAIKSDDVPAWANETLARNGTLTLAFEYRLADSAAPDGMRKVVGYSAPVSMSEPNDIAPGKTAERLYSFTIDKVPKEAKEVKYRLVYRGKLGEEADGIAVGNVEPMSGFVVTPDYVPSDGIAGPRLIYRAWNEWRLSEKQGVIAGNIDWKGWYSDGKPAKILSWKGPRSRYFPDSGSPFSAEVYQNGELFARAPKPVVGAALSRDPQGVEWLIVITKDHATLSDVVYRRPNKKSDSTGLHNATNPDGWRQIGRFDHGWRKFHDIDVPWFFNGNGTTAQTMRAGDKLIEQTGEGATWLYRLEIGLTGDLASATFSNHDNTSASSTTRSQLSCSDDGIAAGNGESTTSGQYGMAVDFHDAEPLVALVSLSGSADAATAYYSLHQTKLENQDNIAVTIRIPNVPDIELPFAFTLNAFKDTLAVTHKSDVTQLHMHYMDLRRGFYSAYKTTTNLASTGPLALSQTCCSYFYSIRTTKQAMQSVQIASDNFLFNQNPASVTTGFSSVFQGSLNFSKCNTNMSTVRTIAPEFLRPTFNYGGNWAVDSQGRIVISQPLLGNEPTVQTGGAYNYLAGGNLHEVIPGNSSQPRYTDIGVVK